MSAQPPLQHHLGPLSCSPTSPVSNKMEPDARVEESRCDDEAYLLTVANSVLARLAGRTAPSGWGDKFVQDLLRARNESRRSTEEHQDEVKVTARMEEEAEPPLPPSIESQEPLATSLLLPSDREMLAELNDVLLDNLVFPDFPD